MPTKHSVCIDIEDPGEHFLSWLGSYEGSKKVDSRRGVVRQGSVILRSALFGILLVVNITIGSSLVWMPYTLKLYQARTLSLTVESLEIIGPFDCILFELRRERFCMHGLSVLSVTYDGWEPVIVTGAHGNVASLVGDLESATLSFPKFRVAPGMRGTMTL
ncbi:hypothetical protein FOZ63_004651, partial [Perkinsus olseni]